MAFPEDNIVIGRDVLSFKGYSDYSNPFTVLSYDPYDRRAGDGDIDLLILKEGCDPDEIDLLSITWYFPQADLDRLGRMYHKQDILDSLRWYDFFENADTSTIREFLRFFV